MTAAFGLTWLAAAGFGVAAPALGRRVPGWLLALGGLLLAGLTTATLLLVLTPYVGQQPEVADTGRWSHAVLAHRDPVPSLVVGLVGLGLAWLLVRVVALGAGDGRRLLAAWRLAGADDALLVLDRAEPVAYALPARPGRSGRVVVSSGLLRRLDADGRRALLAHERAHLRHRHDLLGLAAGLAAALNPLLWRLPDAAAAAAERQADAAAVTAVGDRRLVAAAIAVAVGVAPPPGLAAGGADVVRRVEALLGPTTARPGRTALSTATVLVFLVAGLATTLWLAQDLDAVFDVAQAAWHH